MHRIRVLTFCFRKLPNYFKLWLKSASYNPNIEFLVITADKDKYDTPPNVEIINMGFNEVLHKVKKKFDCPIGIQDPYKFCDLRPAFGYLFTEWFEGYDFWGGCDLDVIFGDILGFLTDDILSTYDKILTRDHFYLYRNTEEVNKRFMLPVYGKDDFYKQVLADHKLYCFGERKPWGLFAIYNEHGFSMYDAPIVADIQYQNKQFVMNEIGGMKRQQILLWDKGKLRRLYITECGGIEETEFMYTHLQKRPMEVDITTEDRFLIVPNGFVSSNELVTKDIVLRHSKKPIIYCERMKQLFVRIKNPAKYLFFQG